MAGFFDFETARAALAEGNPVVVDTGPVDYPGGGTGTMTGTAEGAGFDTLATEEGAPLALAYGKHVLIGNLVYHKRVEGPPPVVTAVYAQGEGQWNAAVKAWYVAEELTIVPLNDGTTRGVHFHPGTLSSGTGDPLQGEDTYTPGSGQTHNRTAVSVVKLPERYSTEERPDKFRGIYECLLVEDYDSSGVSTGLVYSANPALVAAHLILKRRKLAASRIDWASWTAWKNFCAQTLSWNDGTTTRTIPRFEAHMAFTSAVSLRAALNAICGVSCCRWQDDGEKIRFLLPTDTTVQHVFGAHNVKMSSVVYYQRDAKSLPRHMMVKFRDLFDEFLREDYVEIRRDALISSLGDVVDQRFYPNMNHSQVQRVGQYQMRLETDFRQMLELDSDGSAIHLLKGDFVEVQLENPFLNGTYLVNGITDRSPERTPDERHFRLQKITGLLYSDADHGPVQRQVNV